MRMRRWFAILLIFFLVAAVGSAQARRSTGSSSSTSRFVLTVNSNIRNSQVFLNAVLQNGRTPLRLTLPEGTYTITVRAPGYRDFTQDVGLTANATLNATLQPITHALAVNSNVKDAAVYIDNDLKGSAPIRVDMPPGRYTVRVIAPGHKDFSDIIDLNQNITVGANLEAITYNLSVNSNVRGSTVFINNNNRGEAPITVALNAGRYSVRVTAPGYVEHNQSIELNQDASVSAMLQPVTYTLSVSSNVNGASVYINNNSAGSAPARATLEQGSYTVRVVAAGYLEYSQNVQLTRNTSINAVLQPAIANVEFGLPDRFLNQNERTPFRLFTVYIDGQKVPPGQIGRFEVPAGRRRIRVESGGFAHESDYDFEAGKSYKLELNITVLLKPSDG